MKPKLFFATGLLYLVLAYFPFSPCRAQAAEAQQLMLNMEKLSRLKQILADMRQGYEMLTQGYQAVRDIAEGNFSLHKRFLDGLLQINPAVRDYTRVAGILRLQKQTLAELRLTQTLFRSPDLFSSREFAYLSQVSRVLLDTNSQTLEELTVILTAAALRMDDAERLEAIDRLYLEVENRLAFLRHFRGEAQLLARQRLWEKSQINALRNLYPSILK